MVLQIHVSPTVRNNSDKKMLEILLKLYKFMWQLIWYVDINLSFCVCVCVCVCLILDW